MKRFLVDNIHEKNVHEFTKETNKNKQTTR